MRTRSDGGWRLVAVASLLAMAACTSATTTGSGTAPVGGAHVADASVVRNDTASVGAVSDALGQRLDGMLGTRQVSR
jgi:hypothetical protein